MAVEVSFACESSNFVKTFVESANKNEQLLGLGMQQIAKLNFRSRFPYKTCMETVSFILLETIRFEL